MHRVIEISFKERQKYNAFVEKHALGSIHQTWEWGEFQSKNTDRDKFWVFTVEDENNKIIASALVVRQKLPLNKSWLYCPRGPLLDYKNKKICALLFNKIASLAREQNAVFFRFDPPIFANNQERKDNIQSSPKPYGPTEEFYKGGLKQFSARSAHTQYQPESTLVLDLALSEEQLLAGMKQKGRYNIKIAQKHEIQINVSNNAHRDISLFYNLLKQTMARDQFSAHSLGYYQALFEVFNKKNSIQRNVSHAKLYLASYQQKPVAAIVVTYFKDTATYYFGASSNQFRNTMAPYLLQWQAILDAKNAGYHYYDFFGIAPENQPKHPWAGVSDFKLKFGGERINYLPAQEIVYQPFWYSLIKMTKWLKSFL